MTELESSHTCALQAQAHTGLLLELMCFFADTSLDGFDMKLLPLDTQLESFHFAVAVLQFLGQLNSPSMARISIFLYLGSVCADISRLCAKLAKLPSELIVYGHRLHLPPHYSTKNVSSPYKKSFAMRGIRRAFTQFFVNSGLASC